MPLICPVCGSHVVLPEHSSVEVGITLSKDTDGNYYLEMEKESKKMKAQERIDELKRNGVDTSCYFAIGDDVLVRMENGIPVRVDFDRDAVAPSVQDIASEIEDSGDVFNAKLDGRWIMAQMFRMMGLNSWYTDGYTDALHRKGYNYQWDFICGKSSGNNKGEIYRLMKREQDGEDLSFKSKFINAKTVSMMMDDYIVELKKYIASRPLKRCGGSRKLKIEGAPYIRLGRKYRMLTKKENGDIFVADIYKLYVMYDRIVRETKRCRTYADLYKKVKEFKKVMIKLNDCTPMSEVFKSMYKANGAYYTLDNMIRFHGCKIKGCNGKRDSIAELNRQVNNLEYNEGYKLLGLLRNTIQFNEFSFK